MSSRRRRKIQYWLKMSMGALNLINVGTLEVVFPPLGSLCLNYHSSPHTPEPRRFVVQLWSLGTADCNWGSVGRGTLPMLAVVHKKRGCWPLPSLPSPWQEQMAFCWRRPRKFEYEWAHHTYGKLWASGLIHFVKFDSTYKSAGWT